MRLGPCLKRRLAINPEDAGALAGDARSYMIDKVYPTGQTRMSITTPRLSGRPTGRSRSTPTRSTSLSLQKSFYLSLVLHRPGRRAASRQRRPRFESRLRVPLLLRKWYGQNPRRDVRVQAKSDILHAIQLPSPRDPGLGLWLFGIGLHPDIGLRTFRGRCDR